MRAWKVLAALAAFVLVAVPMASADSLVTTRPSGIDMVDWSQLGGPFTTIPQGFSFVSSLGDNGTGFLSGGPGQVRVESTGGWGGNFTSGDSLVWTQGNSNSLSLGFTNNYTQIGAQIQADFFGPFTAQICDNNLACFTENGTSNSNNDGSAIYLGVSGSNINSVTFSLTSAPFGSNNDFAINQVSLTGTPEPSSLMLLGTTLFGLGGMVRRRRKTADPL